MGTATDQSDAESGAASAGRGDAAGPPRVFMPSRPARPFRSVLWRVALAALILAVTVALVFADRAGYRDTVDPHLTFVDCLYYSTVTLSTTGYGDIVPASQGARLVNALVITPMRVLFLIILVGTTLEVLTERTRREWRQARWRRRLRDHVVIVGFGTKGRSAAATLTGRGVPASGIVVVDERPKAIAAANGLGMVGILGDGTRAEVLTQAGVPYADTVVIACQRDDTAVLTTLAVRRMNPGATVAAAVREADNALLLRQSGATTVITSSDAAGRLLGAATLSPRVGEVVMDLLASGDGMDIEERPAEAAEAGLSPRACREPVLAVVRGGRLMRHDDPQIGTIRADDHLIVVHSRAVGSADRERRHPSSAPG